ncbi:porin family protein [Thalassoroseus pseudoceratinae]|uniref:porin n=1 Tax=Thalassoroseus pseudoceratinae TaxID=2713176 RepID=UPI0014219F71|nr:porin [Thalassoroseus pseudoceratinae]
MHRLLRSADIICLIAAGLLIAWSPANVFGEDVKSQTEWFEAGYDNGLFLHALQDNGHSFALKSNVRGQFRYSAFIPNSDVPPPLVQTESNNESRSAFDVERARLLFSGHAFDPDLTFFTQIDGDTDGDQTLEFLDYWVANRRNEHLTLLVGRRRVPGVRQWLLSSMNTRLVDRPVPVDFFRPGRTVGLWAFGKIVDDLHYETMVGNGYRTSNLASGEFGEGFVVAGQVRWTPLAEFGVGVTDFEYHDELAVALGQTLTFSSQNDRRLGETSLPEVDTVREINGVRLAEAFAMFGRVTGYDVTVYSVDAAFKYRGWSMNGEYIFRSIGDLHTQSGLSPSVVIDQHGFYLEGGKFLIPQRLDVNARISKVFGRLGSAYEYACGLNYFPTSDRRIKLSMDATRLIDVPLQNPSSDINVGDNGVLIRTQLQLMF